MDPAPSRPWYKKKRYIIPSALVGGLVVIGSVGGNTTSSPYIPPATQTAAVEQAVTSQQTESSVIEQSPTSAQQAQIDLQSSANTSYTAPPPLEPATTQDNPQLSNDIYYTNSAGNEVHSPAYTSDSLVPAGASARCGDGTYSFSQSRRGTCSHHGGVATWY
jgi:hypothetical protein